MILSTDVVLSHLTLPATLKCKFPARLPIQFGTAFNLGPFELLAIPLTHFSVLIAACEASSAWQAQEYVKSLLSGQLTDSVPIVLAEGDELRTAGRIEILSALQQLGHTLLPVLATARASAALRDQAAAQEKPTSWTLA